MTNYNITPSAMRAWEGTASKIADDLYEELFPCYEVDRSDCGPRSQKQYQDIDLELMDRLTGDRTTISEKFRRTNYGDMLIEYYDEHHSDNRGWGLYSKAELIHYFVPSAHPYHSSALYVVIEKDIKNVLEKLLKTYSTDANAATYKDILSKQVAPGIRVITTTVCGRRTCSFCVTWKKLSEMGVRFERYDISEKIDRYLKS